MVDALLEATARVLETSPLEATTTNAIAERAGVSVGSLYQYFPNKASLAAALIERKLQLDLEQMQRDVLSAAPTSLEDVLRRCIATLVEIQRRDQRLMRHLLLLVPQVGQHGAVRGAVALTREAFGVLLEAFSSEIRAVDLALATFILGHTLESLTHAAIFEKPELLEDPRFAEELFFLARRYLGRPGET